MDSSQVKRIAVVGAGLIGHSVAQEFALAGYEVNLVSRSEEGIQKALERIQANLSLLVNAGVTSKERAESVIPNIQTTTVLDDAVRDSDLVIEAVYENLPLKQTIFHELDDNCPAHTILASATSTLMPSALASATKRPDKVIVAHYANPPHLMPLVEVVPGAKTSEHTIEAVMNLLTGVGKSPVLIRQEVPGFVTNRLQSALLREALSLVQNGVVSPQDVDTIIKTSIGRRWAVAGVFEVFEIAGWDLISAAAEYLLPHLDNASEVPQLLRDKVANGELGVKTGKGFYEWTPESAEALRQRIAHALIEIEKWSPADVGNGSV